MKTSHVDHLSLFPFFAATLILTLVIFDGAIAQWPPPTPTFDNWLQFSSTAAGPFDNNINTAIVGLDGRLYVAGSFTDGNIRPGRVARWTGSAWEILGDRFTSVGTFTTFDAIAADGSGNVYVSGNFSTAFNATGPGVDANKIAKWDEAQQAWQAVGGGTVQTASALCVFNNEIYVGGIQTAYNQPGGGQVTIPRIGRWNVTSSVWEPVGQGVQGGPSFVSSMIATGTGFYMSGGFLTAVDGNGTMHTVNGITFWNGSQWGAVGNGLYPLGSSAGDLTLDAAGQLYCAGPFQGGVNGNGTQVPGKIIRWNGSQWTNEAPSFSSGSIVTEIEIDGSDSLYAYVYDSNTQIQVLMVKRSGVWVAKGRFQGEVLSVIAGRPNLPNFGLYAGGLFTQILDPSTSQTYVITNHARLLGGTWQEMVSTGPPTTGTVYALGSTPLQGSLRLPSHVYAGGLFGSVEGVPANNIARTDGLGWSPVGLGVNGPVYAIIDAAGWVFVGGLFTKGYDADGFEVDVNNLAMWNPSTGRWSSVASGVSGAVYALDAYILAGLVRLYVGGDFDSAFVDPNRNGERVNSIVEFQTLNISFTPWEIQKLGEGVYGRARIVRAIGHLEAYSNLTPDGHLYIGGSFTGAQDFNGLSIDSPNIIRWKPRDSTWSAVGLGVNNDVRAIALDNPYLIFPRVWVGGDFTMATNGNGTSLTTRHMALWNDPSNQWNTLQGGTDGPVYSIARLKETDFDGAFIGGDFTTGYINVAGTNSRSIQHVGLYIISDSIPHVPFNQNWNERALNGNGTNGPVYSLISLPFCFGAGENVYVGGNFSVAGNRSAGSLARWRYHWDPPVFSYSASWSGTSMGIGGRGPSFECSTISMSPGPDIVYFDSLGFRESAVINSIPFNEPLMIYTYRLDGSFLAGFNVTIDGAVPKAMTFIGVDDTTIFAPNPEGISTRYRMILKDLPVTGEEPSNVHLVFLHAVTDAPTVNIALQGGSILVEGLSFGQASDSMTNLPPGSYTFDVQRSSDSQILGSYPIDLTGKAGEVVMMAFSGFLDPSANQNGPLMSLEEVPTGTSILPQTGIGGDNSIPEVFALEQNYPNPFNPTTKIKFTLSSQERAGVRSFVSLKVYDVLGREVATLVNEVKQPGSYEVTWDAGGLARQTAGGLASGIYFYRITAGEFRQAKKLILLR